MYPEIIYEANDIQLTKKDGNTSPGKLFVHLKGGKLI